jgi:DNA-binding response OmpR family regulator
MNDHQPTLLLADDDAAWRQAMQLRLSSEGFRVITAGDGEEAIARFDSTTIDLALLDVQLPGIDGFGVCEHIRSLPKGSHTPVVFLTGSDSGIVQKHLRALTATVGGDRCLTKTCDASELIRTVREALDEAAAGCRR